MSLLPVLEGLCFGSDAGKNALVVFWVKHDVAHCETVAEQTRSMIQEAKTMLIERFFIAGDFNSDDMPWALRAAFLARDTHTYLETNAKKTLWMDMMTEFGRFAAAN